MACSANNRRTGGAAPAWHLQDFNNRTHGGSRPCLASPGLQQQDTRGEQPLPGISRTSTTGHTGGAAPAWHLQDFNNRTHEGSRPCLAFPGLPVRVYSGVLPRQLCQPKASCNRGEQHLTEGGSCLLLHERSCAALERGLPDSDKSNQISGQEGALRHCPKAAPHLIATEAL